MTDLDGQNGTMQMFRWSSSALKNYGKGAIIAIGRDVEEARENARSQWLAYAEEHWDWLFGDVFDIESIREGEQKTAEFEADIAAEPQTGVAFFIRGSE